MAFPEIQEQEHDLFTTNPDIRETMEEKHVIRIGYKKLRDLLRKEGK